MTNKKMKKQSFEIKSGQLDIAAYKSLKVPKDDQ